MPANPPPIRFVPSACWLALALALTCNCAIAQPAADIESLEAAVQRGEPQAMVLLASRYERGENVQRDFIRANELYCKAAARGDSEALLKLGIIYSIGRGVPADAGIAALLVGKAAELGNDSAKRLIQFAGQPTDSVPPACLSEAVGPRVPSTVSAARKDIELLVRHWAPQYAIDPDLVMALIAVESGFNVAAVSPKNAQGLMQLIPGTAVRFGVRNVYNPQQNLQGGLAYLRWLMAYFQGEVALVLAAYNAGEETVERYRGVPPYAETRNYVKQITSVYKKARHPYLTEVAAPSAVFGRLKRVE
ncbi:MAG: transglycosylase SLT domain-containing protein [Betaproteobacteria bacterium]